MKEGQKNLDKILDDNIKLSLIEKIELFVRITPNDQELGSKIRELSLEIEKRKFIL